MRTVKLNSKAYKIRSKFEEVTVADFEACSKLTKKAEMLQLLSDIPANIIGQLRDDQIDALWHLIEWRVEELEVPEFPPVDVGDLSFGKLEEAKGLLADCTSVIFGVPGVLRVYGVKVKDADPITKYLGRGYAFLKGINDFLLSFEDLSKGSEPTDEQVLAGIDSLKSFGSFSVLYHLCDGNPLKFEEMLNCPAYDIYETMRYKGVLGEYQDNLNKIHGRLQTTEGNSKTNSGKD